MAWAAACLGNTNFWIHTAAACEIRMGETASNYLAGLRSYIAKVAQGYTQPIVIFGISQFWEPYIWPSMPTVRTSRRKKYQLWSWRTLLSSPVITTLPPLCYLANVHLYTVQCTILNMCTLYCALHTVAYTAQCTLHVIQAIVCPICMSKW